MAAMADARVDEDNRSEDAPLVKPIEFEEVSRRKWGAEDSLAKTELLIPVTKILLLYGTRTKPCTKRKHCVQAMRHLQAFQMVAKKMPDINYNFLIGGDGNVYEGRGFHKKVSGRPDYTPDSLFIGFIGDYTTEDPPQIFFEVTDAFIQKYVKEGKISSNYRKRHILGY